MAYQWLSVTEDFDKTLVIKKWRYDGSYYFGGNIDGALSELPNIDIADCWDNSQPENGYAFSNRFNIGQDYFSSRYYGFTDGKWTATTTSHTTQVDTDIYEFECPVDLYWAGFRYGWDPSYENKMWFYVETSSFDITPSAATATKGSGSTTISVDTDNDNTITWTASTTDAWISLSPSTGAGDGSVTVSYAANSSPQDRVGTVTFTSNGGDVLTFTLTQEKKGAIVYDHPIYRSGSLIKKMYRSGELIYLRLNPPSEEPEPPTPPSPLEEPVTLTITAAGNIKWYAQNNSYTKTIQYSKNGGEWTNITSSQAGTMIPVVAGDVVRLRGDNAQYAPVDGRCSCFSGTTAGFTLSGNIMSLVDSTNFATLSSFTAENVFMNFFNNCTGLTDASDLLLPATALTNYCYQGLLAQCTSLLKGPLLSVETLTTKCYAYFYYHTYNLQEIRCLAVTTTASNCLQEWVNGVQTSSGTFYKNPNKTNWGRGNAGVPNNWTIVDYS